MLDKTYAIKCKEFLDGLVRVCKVVSIYPLSNGSYRIEGDCSMSISFKSDEYGCQPVLGVTSVNPYISKSHDNVVFGIINRFIYVSSKLNYKRVKIYIAQEKAVL